jgi:hypothetical protein
MTLSAPLLCSDFMSSVSRLPRMVLTAKFGCARLYSRIICADIESRRLNLQSCFAEYQWIIAYAQKYDIQIFQEELALCREMVSATACQCAWKHVYTRITF